MSEVKVDSFDIKERRLFYKGGECDTCSRKTAVTCNCRRTTGPPIDTSVERIGTFIMAMPGVERGSRRCGTWACVRGPFGKVCGFQPPPAVTLDII